jgi:predicted ATPase
VALQALSDANLVPAVIAETVGARVDLAAHLHARRTLLLLDSLEHLLPAAPALADLLAECAELRLLVTSRAPLRIAAEHELPLEPLPEREASTLFVERARAAGRRIDADETVARICRRLDNLPLALELAAARTRLLDPRALLARLDRRLPVLTGGRRDAPERQRTLRATIAWSHDLLDEDAQSLFARVAVFAGSFALEAVEEVCDADLDALGALVELSLLKPVEDARFVLLETIREFGLERLEESGEDASVRDRHAAHFLAVAERLARRRGDPEALERLGKDHDDIRAALAWLHARGEIERELRLAVAASQFRWIRGHQREQRRVLTEALAAARDADAAVRADARAALAFVSFFLGDREEWRRSADESLALARAVDDPHRIEWALRVRAFGEPDLGERRRLLAEAEAITRSLGDNGALAWVLHTLGMTALEERRYHEARARLEECVSLNRALGRAFETANALSDLGFVALADERYDDARRVLRESLRAALDIGANDLAASCLVWIAAVALAYGDGARAAQLLGAAARVRDETGTIFEPVSRPFAERTEADTRRAVGAAFEREWEAGRGLTPGEAAALALGES